MNQLIQVLGPEIVLGVAACVLFLLGVMPWRGARLAAPWVALSALLVVIYQLISMGFLTTTLADPWDTVRVNVFAWYIKLLTACVGCVLVLLAWPTDAQATGNSALRFGGDAGEFFALMLLSLMGVFIVASANDMILFFLGVELASIPTYVMVSISRPLPAAQEAGVKYFFLGAMSAALMLFGFSYLFGTTGTLNLHQIGMRLMPTDGSRVVLGSWQMMAGLMILVGLAFKIAAVPLHFYAGDVYQGAATPVTAFLSFVPKISGFVAIIKILFVLGGTLWMVPMPIFKLLWIMAALTMTVGNVLGLMQFNVKRVMAYSSIAHSGYMLVGLTALVGTTAITFQIEALQGVLFYLTAYGIMNAGVFGVLMALPSRQSQPATSAETFEDLAGQGRKHPVLGLAMTICCLSLIGLPLTMGFFGKVYLIRPALHANLYWLVVLMVVNAAVSAGYYLRIVGAMFLRAEMEGGKEQGNLMARNSWTLHTAIAISAAGTLLLGTIIPLTGLVNLGASQATTIDLLTPMTAGTATLQGGAEILP